MTVGLEIRGFCPLFSLRTEGKMSKEKSQSSGVGTEQSTEDCFQLWFHFLRLTQASSRRLIWCNLTLAWWVTPVEILPTCPRGGDGDGGGGRKLHPPKPVGDQLILKIISDLHFFSALSLFTFHKPGRMGGGFIGQFLCRWELIRLTYPNHPLLLHLAENFALCLYFVHVQLCFPFNCSSNLKYNYKILRNLAWILSSKCFGPLRDEVKLWNYSVKAQTMNTSEKNVREFI